MSLAFLKQQHASVWHGTQPGAAVLDRLRALSRRHCPLLRARPPAVYHHHPCCHHIRFPRELYAALLPGRGGDEGEAAGGGGGAADVGASAALQDEGQGPQGQGPAGAGHRKLRHQDYGAWDWPPGQGSQATFDVLSHMRWVVGGSTGAVQGRLTGH